MEKIDICNYALIEAHQDATITNLDENSVEAERCRRIYDATRRELLSVYPWSFATKFLKLARVSEDVEGYKYAYKYPDEALRINDFYVNETAYKAKNFIPFDLVDAKIAIVNGDKCICCDYEEPFVSENVDVSDEKLLPESFCRLFYLFMAQKITKMAGAKAEIRSEIASEINTQLSLVATTTNRENKYEKDLKNYYVDVRR
jgi:hypothetical protein